MIRYTYMNINPSIFKAYDIRGVYPDEITPEAAYRIGRAFGDYIRITVLNKERDPAIVVSRDARISSSELTARLVQGLRDEQCQVLDCGLSTTPLHTFAVNHLNADGGIMVTASHNPAAYNGFKMSRRGSMAVGAGAGMEEIRNAVLRGVFPPPQKKGRVEERNVTDAYLDFIFSDIDQNLFRGMKIVCDVGNGMVGLLLPSFLKRLPVNAHILFGDVDMTFPNHEANPLKEETLGVLKQTVIDEQANLGVAFDGDGDRVRFVTSKGTAVSGDMTTAIFAKHILKSHPRESVVYTINASRIVEEVIREEKGIPVESKIGHAFVKQVMREYNAVLGGEVSGHFYWRDFFFAESALLATLHMLVLLSESGKTLDELVYPLLRYASSGEINLTIADKDKTLDALVAHYRDAKELKYVDGISVLYDDFWFNVRPSNTEPLLRISMEAKEKSVLDTRLQELLAIVQRR